MGGPPHKRDTGAPTSAGAVGTMGRNAIRAIERLPLLVFGMMYTVSCYLGVMLLLLSTDFWAWTNYFTGVRLPSLTLGNLVTLLILLYGGPILVWGGYELGCTLSKHHWKREETETTHREERATKLAMGLYFISVGFAVWSLVRGGAFSRLADWTDYNFYVLSRWHLFSTLTFIEYVNLYTWLPLLSTYLILSKRKWWVIGPLVGVLSLLQVSLFVKKALLTSILLICAAWWAYLYLGKAPRKLVQSRVWLYSVLTGGSALCVIYGTLTLILVYSDFSRPFEGRPVEEVEKTEAQSWESFIVTFDREVVPFLKGKAVALYTLFSPLTRTSVPAIAYSALFPDRIPFYHIDLGMDIIEVGRMPDDNLVVFNILWPEQKGGSVQAPFHFVLYSQGGLGVALCGSFLVGILLAVIWLRVVAPERLTIEGSLFASLILVFAWFLSIDSLRNSLLVSYGVLWGALLVLALRLLKYRETHEYPVPPLRREGGA